MSVAATKQTSQDQPDDRKRWTQDDCRKLEAIEMLEAGHYELIDGVIYLKLGQNVPHSRANLRTIIAMSLTFGGDYVLLPVSLSIDAENSPEPDVLITRHPTQNMVGRRPVPADARLIIEVADATLWRDTNTKRRLYARAGVPEYWVLDLNNEQLLVYRNPTSGNYGDPLTLNKEDSVTPLAAPDKPVRVADLLP